MKFSWGFNFHPIRHAYNSKITFSQSTFLRFEPNLSHYSVSRYLSGLGCCQFSGSEGRKVQDTDLVEDTLKTTVAKELAVKIP